MFETKLELRSKSEIDLEKLMLDFKFLKQSRSKQIDSMKKTTLIPGDCSKFKELVRERKQIGSYIAEINKTLQYKLKNP